MSKKNRNCIIKNTIVVVLGMIIVCIILALAPNYIQDDVKDKTNLVINQTNVTKRMKSDVYIDENEIVYIAKDDIANYFDSTIYYDEQYDKIITGSSTQIADFEIGKRIITVNGSNKNIYGAAFKKDDIYYIPFSELSDIYQVETTYLKETNTVVIESLDKKLIKANSSKNQGIKYKPTTFSRSVDKVEKGESLVILESDTKGWTRVRTQGGKIGYVKENSISNKNIVREDFTVQPQIQGKVSLAWDYFSEYARAPKRDGTTISGVNVVSPAFFALKKLGKGEIDINIGDSGKSYINWAHNNGYKVWPILSNNSMIDTTSEIMRDYALRQKLIDRIVELVVEYNLDGINIDFENMYREDKNLFSRFIIELAPRLKEMGKVVSVDVTAPDGSDTWSLCFDRYQLAKTADYIIFMAYDQYGTSSAQEGTTAGCDWVEANVEKFLGQEGVPSDKLILALPFYTRLWIENDGKITSDVVNMKSIDTVLPEDVERIWNDNLKQHYVEYQKQGKTYKMWIEDAKSISAKLDVMKKYNLAGAAYWAKDRETEDIWNIVEKYIY